MRRVSAVCFALLLFAATSSALSAQQSIYMLADTIRGDQPAPHDREFKLNSFSSGAEKIVTIGSATTGTGKTMFPPVQVTMNFSPVSSPSFYRNLTAGTKLASVEIRFYNSARMYYKTVFENVYLTKVGTAGSDQASQEIDFVYSRVKWFAPTDVAGLTGPVLAGCWDLTANAPRC